MSSHDPQVLANAIRCISIDAIVRAAEGHQASGIEVTTGPLGQASQTRSAWRCRGLLLEQQDNAYCTAVLGPELGSGWASGGTALWDRYLGRHGGSIGMAGFGASGPAQALYELFGITPAAVATEAGRLLQSAR